MRAHINTLILAAETFSFKAILIKLICLWSVVAGQRESTNTPVHCDHRIMLLQDGTELQNYADHFSIRQNRAPCRNPPIPGSLRALNEIKSTFGWRVVCAWIGNDPCGDGDLPAWSSITCSTQSDDSVVSQLLLAPFVRRVVAFVRGDDVIHKLFTELAYQYKSKASGEKMGNKQKNSQGTDIWRRVDDVYVPRRLRTEHAVHCKELPGFKYRHNMVRGVLFDVCSRAGISTKKEAPVNFLTDLLDGRSTLRPADVVPCALDSNPRYLGFSVGMGVKEKQGSMTDKSVEVSKLGNVIGEQVVNEKQSSLVDTTTPNVENTCLNSYPPLPTQGSTPAGNFPSKSSYANVTGESSRKALNF
ncbi:hypothetical protein Tco_0646194, partial [Tanacetum coccineum]